MAQSKQFSYFFLRGYFDSADDVLKAVLACDVRHYAFILHDKDVYSEGSEDHAKGDKKPPHWHICLNLVQKASWNVVSGKILKLYPTCGIWNRNIYDPARAAAYLLHDSDIARSQGKYQYNSSAVFSDGFDYWFTDEAKRDAAAEKVDMIKEFAKEVFKLGWCSPELLDKYFNLYGRDFIFNFERALRWPVRRLRLSDFELIFIKPSLRADYIAAMNSRVQEVAADDSENSNNYRDSKHEQRQI